MVGEFLSFLLDILTWLIILRAILSWIPQMRHNRWYQMLIDLTETFVGPVRRILPASGGMIDFAPLITIFIIQLLESLIWSLF